MHGIGPGERKRLRFAYVIEAVSCPAGAMGFVLLHRRWVVKRTFAWLVRYRKDSQD